MCGYYAGLAWPPPARSPDHHAGVDGELEPGDIPGLLRGQEEHGVADIRRLHAGHRQRVHEHRTEARLTLDESVQRAETVAHRRLHTSRVDRVDPDAIRRQLVGHRLGDADDAVFGGHVRTQ